MRILDVKGGIPDDKCGILDVKGGIPDDKCGIMDVKGGIPDDIKVESQMHITKMRSGMTKVGSGMIRGSEWG